MPVTEGVEVEEPESTLRRITMRSRDAMGISDRMPARVLILFILSAGCAALAPIPANIAGVAAVVLLALDTATHRR